MVTGCWQSPHTEEISPRSSNVTRIIVFLTVIGCYMVFQDHSGLHWCYMITDSQRLCHLSLNTILLSILFRLFLTIMVCSKCPVQFMLYFIIVLCWTATHHNVLEIIKYMYSKCHGPVWKAICCQASYHVMKQGF